MSEINTIPKFFMHEFTGMIINADDSAALLEQFFVNLVEFFTGLFDFFLLPFGAHQDNRQFPKSL